MLSKDLLLITLSLTAPTSDIKAVILHGWRSREKGAFKRFKCSREASSRKISS